MNYPVDYSLRVCYIGPFNPDYSRNRVIIKGLRKNGVEVIECNSRSSHRILNYLKLVTKSPSIKCDAIILGARGDYFGQPIVPFIKNLIRKPIIFDAVLTLTETLVVDRKLVNGKSVKAKMLFLLDLAALKASNLVISDTYDHIKYYSKCYNIEYSRFKKLPIASDNEIFYPRLVKKENGDYTVLFWGKFIPLQGVEYIIQAAKLLEKHTDIRFEMIGSGQEYNECLMLAKRLRVKNIRFLPTWVKYHDLPNYIARSDVCLGIFGGTPKANRVIPNKAIETLAMKKPLITGDSPAARELFKKGDNCFLVPMANPEALANAILTLKNDNNLSKKVAQNGYELYSKKLTPEVIGKELKTDLHDLIKQASRCG